MRKHLAYLLCLCLAFGKLSAQNTPISGTVTDEKGTPLAAVTVTALTSDKKVITTAVTDGSGVFKMNVSGRVRNLQFSYIGLDEALVAVSGRTNFSVTLHASNRNLSEVVVVGYGTQTKKELKIGRAHV